MTPNYNYKQHLCVHGHASRRHVIFFVDTVILKIPDTPLIVCSLQHNLGLTLPDFFCLLVYKNGLVFIYLFFCMFYASMCMCVCSCIESHQFMQSFLVFRLADLKNEALHTVSCFECHQSAHRNCAGLVQGQPPLDALTHSWWVPWSLPLSFAL